MIVTGFRAICHNLQRNNYGGKGMKYKVSFKYNGKPYGCKCSNVGGWLRALVLMGSVGSVSGVTFTNL